MPYGGGEVTIYDPVRVEDPEQVVTGDGWEVRCGPEAYVHTVVAHRNGTFMLTIRSRV